MAAQVETPATVVRSDVGQGPERSCTQCARVIKGLGAIILIAAGSIYTLRWTRPWVHELGFEDPRAPFVLVFLMLLTVVVTLKLALDRRRR